MFIIGFLLGTAFSFVLTLLLTKSLEKALRKVSEEDRKDNLHYKDDADWWKHGYKKEEEE